MALSAVDVIGPAFEHMKRQLFSPFRFGQWVRLAVVGLLAGEMGTGGGCSGQFPSGFGNSSEDQQFQGAGPFAGGGVLFLVGIGILILLGLAVGIAILYISSRMRFVLFDSILAKECRIREFWGQRGEEGFRYFIFQILFSLGAAVGMAVLIGLPALLAFGMGWVQSPREHLLPLILGGAVLALVFFALIVTLAVVKVLIKDFVIPQMALDGVTVGEGWNRVWTMVKEEKGGYAAYLGMKLVLAIAAAVVLGIVALIALVLVLIPVGGIGAVAVFGGMAAGVGWNPLTIALAIVCGILVLLALLLMFALISVPAIAFFPAYSIYFFAERYAALKMALIGPPSPQP